MLTCSLSELHGFESMAAFISYIVLSLLPLLPVLGKAVGRGITQASKVGVMRRRSLFWK